MGGKRRGSGFYSVLAHSSNFCCCFFEVLISCLSTNRFVFASGIMEILGSHILHRNSEDPFTCSNKRFQLYIIIEST